MAGHSCLTVVNRLYPPGADIPDDPNADPAGIAGQIRQRDVSHINQPRRPNAFTPCFGNSS
jgi:hypothetical protein